MSADLGQMNGHKTERYGGLVNHEGALFSLLDRKPSAKPERVLQPGTRLISAAAAMLLLLGVGLLIVSLAAQYRYVLAERHQPLASGIEAAALDLGMCIFACLALGLARNGQSAKVERGLVVACAAGSALMNYAASNASSPRSVLAYVLPPLYLAVVVDRVAVTVRRHVLGIKEGRSPWAASGRVVLYLLRVVLAPPSTLAGGRQLVLQATPMPTAAVQAIEASSAVPPDLQVSNRPETKTGRFLALVTDQHGPLSEFPLDAVSRVACELAPQVDLDPGAARTALRKNVLQAQNGTQS